MKVKVLYQTAIEVEVEVDEKFAECIHLADIPWEEFPRDRIYEWYGDCYEMRSKIAEKLSQNDYNFDHVIGITTENDNIIYEG